VGPRAVRLAPGASSLAAIAIAGTLAARAVTGVPAGRAFRDGQQAVADGRLDVAARSLDRAAAGKNRSEALWLAARARIDLWWGLTLDEQRGPRGSDLLGAATARLLAERIASPASAWPTSDLGSVYACRETAARRTREIDLAALERGPWALVGEDGRIAIGLLREAIEREPAVAAMRDQLVLVLDGFGLRDEAVAAMAETARVLPDFDKHPAFSFEALPRDLVDAFWRASRAADPRDTPLQSGGARLVSSGKLGRRLGHLDEAEQDLRAALAVPATSLTRAEAAFHLAQVLVDRRRYDEAEPFLSRALAEPVFGPGVAGTRARIAEQQERWSDALGHLRDLRRWRGRDLDVLMEFADVARRAAAWEQAEEALRWAVVVRPDAPAPRRALVELFAARGDVAGARRALDDYLRSSASADDKAAAARLVARALDPTGR
jgi:tetratricopeptide (TPR) repeat protein